MDGNLIAQTVAAVRAGKLDQAAALAEAGLARGVEHPLLLNLRAYRLERQDRLAEALEALRKARILAPDDPSILNALGLCLGRLDRLHEALEAFEAAVRAAPEFVQAHANRGRAYDSLGLLVPAREAFAEAARLDPAAADPLANLAHLAARRGDAAEARALAERALALQPAMPAAVQALAQADMLERRFEDAAERLSRLANGSRLESPDRAMTLSLLGDALDGLGQAPQAFAAYLEGNLELRKLYAPRFSGWTRQSAREMADWLADYFRAADPAAWAEAPARQDAEAPLPRLVFLVGFPRSGTTLLEQVLAAHPAVATLEEVELFGDAVREFMREPASLDRLAHIGPADAERLRAAYWAGVRETGADLGRAVLVDKLPLNSLKLPLIAKLFPEAKILLAERDPRDVVFSCFRRRFRMNASMYELLTLEGAARFYDSVMGLIEACRAKLPLDVQVVRYERLVQDFAGEVGRVCGFLGLGWSEAMETFSDRARSGAVATPSAAQVARGLYKEGMGQWRAYEAQLAPVAAILSPWVARLGYPEGGAFHATR